MHNQKLLVSVIIPTFNRKKMLVECLDSVEKSTYTNLEVLVADDASTDDTEHTMRKYEKRKKVTYLRNSREHLLSATINRAVKRSRGELIFILDDDNVIDRDCITQLVSTFEKFEEVGIVGPLALYYSHPDVIMHAGTKRSGFARGFTSPHAGEKWRNQIKEGEEVEDFGNAFMFRREAAKRAGLWDLLVPFQGEDGDFEARVKKAGYRIVINPKAKTYHNIVYSPETNTALLFFPRASSMRVYHGIHSKILYEFRYESISKRLTFCISLPAYLGFYVIAAIKSKSRPKDKLFMLGAIIKGFGDGFRDAILNKNEVEYLK